MNLVKFNNAKTTIAAPATKAQEALAAMGDELGHSSADNDLAWKAALKAVKSPADRIVLRTAFVASYMGAVNCGQKSAENRFDYLARIHAKADTSRKAKANAKKRKAGGGRKEKQGATKTVLSEKQLAARVVKALAYIGDMQQKHAADGDMLEMLGTLAKILGGDKK